MLCCVQSGLTALYWAAREGDVNIVQMLVNHGAAVDLGRDVVTNHDYLLTCGWSFGYSSHTSTLLITTSFVLQRYG